MAATAAVQLLLAGVHVVATETSENLYIAHMQRSCQVHAAVQRTNCKWCLQLKSRQQRHTLDNKAWLVDKIKRKINRQAHIMDQDPQQ